MATNDLILSCSPFADTWLASVRTDGGMRQIKPTTHRCKMKAGDVVAAVRAEYPGYRIGVLAATGDDVLWSKD
jgi:hypothetical protein